MTSPTRDVFQLELEKRGVVQAVTNDVTGGIELSAGDETDIISSVFKSGNQIDLSFVPGFMNGEFQYNCMSHDNVVIYDGYLYAVYWSHDGKPTIARRKDAAGERWASFDLSTISGNPIGTVAADNHNYLAIAISGDGVIHVAGNCHVTQLKYVVGSVSAWNTAASWSSGTMIGTEEAEATYPSFIDHGDGEISVLYRNGLSGNGLWYLNRYANGTWTRTANVFGNAGVTGGDGDSNAYPTRAVYRDGKLHIAFTWRTTGNADSNYSVCYAVSEDKGSSWRKSDGTTYTLPIQPNTSEIAMATAPTGSGLLNNQMCGLAVDGDGTPHIVYQKTDPLGYTNYFYIKKVDGVWVDYQVTTWDYTYALVGGIATGVVSRPDILLVNDKPVILYRHNARERGGVFLLDVSDPENPKKAKLIDADLRAWEPGISGQALYRHNRVVILAAATEVYGNAAVSLEWKTDGPWKRQPGIVVQFDANNADSILRGTARIPSVVTDKTIPLVFAKATITTSATPGTQIGTGCCTFRPHWLTEGPVLFRVDTMMRKLTANKLTIGMRTTANGSTGALVDVAETTFDNGGPNVWRSPWFCSTFDAMANRNPQIFASGYVEMFARCNDVNSGEVWDITVSIGRIELR